MTVASGAVRRPWSEAAPAGLLLGALTVLLWASFNVAAKHGIDAGFAPADMSAMRFGVAGTVLAPLIVLSPSIRARLPGWRRTAALTLVGGPLFYVMATSGYRHTTLTHGLLFAPASAFIFGTLFGALWLRERVGRRHFVGGAAMLAGLAVLSGFDIATLGPSTLRGDAMFVVTGATWAFFTALMRRWRVDPVGGVVAVASLSLLLTPATWVAFGGGRLLTAPGHEVGTQLLFQGLIGGVASTLAYFAAVQVMGAARASLLPTLTPGTALAISMIVFGAPARAPEIAGIALVAAGLIVATRRPSITPAPRASA